MTSSADPHQPDRVPTVPSVPAASQVSTDPAPVLRRYAAAPMHLQLEQQMRTRITAGDWPIGARLPTEPELAAEWGVSRGTLRRALAALVADGLLEPVRGRGTFVTGEPTITAIAERFVSLSEDLAKQDIAFTRTVLSQRVQVPPGPVRTALRIDANEPTLRLERLFESDSGPLALVINHVPSARFEGIADVDFASTPLFETLTDRYGETIASGRRTLRAVSASAALASMLGLSHKAPVLHMQQVTLNPEGIPIEYSDIFLDSDRVAITSVLDRE